MVHGEPPHLPARSHVRALRQFRDDSTAFEAISATSTDLTIVPVTVARAPRCSTPKTCRDGRVALPGPRTA